MSPLKSIKLITAPIGALSLLLLSGLSQASNTPAQAPLFTSTTTTPLNMLVLGRDHKLYFEAYNDASDLNGDGVLDIGYKGYLSAAQGGIDYFGYFNSYVCYSYTSSTLTHTETTGYFKPVAHTADKKCSGTNANYWSGDYLNYLTTSRMDALRKVLYGGYRVTDSTTQTILQGAYIPQDSHSWGKEFNAGTPYNIKDYTPFDAPSTGRRHLFSVTSRADNGIPQLQVIKNTSTYRIWHWISKERDNNGVAGTHCNSGSGEAACASDAYNIKVEVCPATANLQDDNCKTYPSTAVKPTGVLHDFGETDRMHFGLLTGSYEKNIAGGVLRANIASFAREVDPSTGQFCTNTGACNNTAQLSNPIRNGIVDNINKLRVYGFHYNPVPNGALNNNRYSWTSCPWIADMEMDQNTTAKCHMWGNPIGEMMYETLRYFASQWTTSGTGNNTTQTTTTTPTGIYNYTNSTPVDTELGLAKPDWVSPYSKNDYTCSVPAMTVISDINPSFDYKVPGSNWHTMTESLPALSGFNASTETDAIGVAEGIHGNDYFIGEANGNYDGAPSSKTINNFSTVRGLAPEEPTRKGSYYAAGVARYGANNEIGGGKKLYTYTVALASPLPEINFKIGSNNITLVPFAKTVSGGFNSYNVNRASAFRPTNPIADLYVEKIANTDPQGSDRDLNENEGRAYMRFRINFEDQEQGADFDMDALATYTLKLSASNQLEVTVNVEQHGGNSWIQNLGYIISGTGSTTDGTYLVVCASGGNNCTSTNSYFSLNTPPNTNPGYCKLPTGVSNHTSVQFSSTGNSSDRVHDVCHKLPTSNTRFFSAASNTASSGILNSPLWYAAKYGIPDRDPATITGDPDNYFLVTNALNLKDQLTQAFDKFKQVNNSVTSPAISLTGNEAADGLFIYRTDYKSRTWSGDLIKEELDLDTGTRTVKWMASNRVPNAQRTVKISNAAGDALVNLEWDQLTGRQAHTNSGQLVYVQQELAKDHANPSNTIPVNNEGTPTVSEDLNRAKNRLNFILGKTDLDIRPRESIIGDIINSSPVIVGGAQYLTYLAQRLEPNGDYAQFVADQANRSKTIYVGANDGMLHGFSDDGTESLAFIPSGVLAELHHLTKTDYNDDGGKHKYYVDATPVVRDVFINGAWRTVLVGTLGAGGRSIFALDITDPDNVDLLWEFNFGDDLAAGGTLSDMGYSFSAPTIAKLHSGHWAVVVGNGYDSPSQQAVLMLIDIATGDLIKKVPATTNDTHNGLSSVRVADNNSDGIADYVYAGDLKGNLWRFDLLDTAIRADNDHPLATPFTPPEPVNPNVFKVSYGGQPLFIARNSSGEVQPITTAPTLMRHPTSKGYLVFIGTGRYFRESDNQASETAIRQSIYGIWDQETLGQVTSAENGKASKVTVADLQAQTMSTVSVSFTVDGRQVTQPLRKLSQTTLTWRSTTTPDGVLGWKLDLGAATPDGERVITPMTARGQVLFASTLVPAYSDCSPSLTGWMYGINPYTGGYTNFAVFDINKDGIFDGTDAYSGFQIPAGGFTLSNDRIFTTDGDSREINFGPQHNGRQAWQIIPEDE